MILDGDPKILNDAPVLKLVGPAGIDLVRTHEEKYQSGGARGLRAHVVLRSRFAEDRLAEAVARHGITQYVILGAGADTFAYRQPVWARSLRIFEVDHPASQIVQRRRLAVAGIEIPSNVTHASIDFETTSLRDGLIATHVDLTVPTFFSWLGVTMYLTEAAIDAVLHTVIGFPTGSEIVFTFAQRSRPAYDGADGPSLAEAAAAVGEPWLSYFEPDELERKLAAVGFSTRHFLTPDEARERYFRGRTDDLAPPRRTSIVSAVV